MTTPTTRKGFFLGLGAAISAALVKAQEIIITPCRPKLIWGNDGRPPICNGQCPNPECDYMAPPLYKRSYVSTISDPISGLIEPLPEYSEIISHGEVYWERDTNGNMLLIPRVRLNRCPKCNTAYWQDPQKEE